MAMIQSTPPGPAASVPFLQWMGGKRRLWAQMKPHFPQRFGAYHEPFVGSGAVFLALQPERAHLSDLSAPLMATWQAVKHHPDEVLGALQALPHGKEAYVNLRAEFNSGTPDPIRAAALFTFLSLTAFNGIMRFNRQGGMNTPYGRNDAIPVEAMWTAHRALATADLHTEDFFKVLDRAQPGDLIYFDPPYDAAEMRYTGAGWTETDTRRLADVARALVAKGCHVRATNHNTPLVREAYAGFRMVSLRRPGNISSKGTGRQPVEEVLIIGEGTVNP